MRTGFRKALTCPGARQLPTYVQRSFWFRRAFRSFWCRRAFSSSGCCFTLLWTYRLKGSAGPAAPILQLTYLAADPGLLCHWGRMCGACQASFCRRVWLVRCAGQSFLPRAASFAVRGSRETRRASSRYFSGPALVCQSPWGSTRCWPISPDVRLPPQSRAITLQ